VVRRGPEPTAAEQAERAIARLFVAGRVGQLAFSALMVAGDRRRFSRPRLQAVLLAGAVAESAWLVSRILRAGRYRDRPALWVDSIFSAVGLVVCGAGLGPGESAPWMKNVAIGAALGAASSDELIDRAGTLGMLGMAATVTGIRAEGRDSHVAGLALALNDIISWVGMHVAVSSYIAAHRRQARLQDDADQLALERAAEVAAETERSHQHRLVHERTVEVLRALARIHDRESGSALARQEAGRLRYILRTKGEVPTDLDLALSEVTEAVGQGGIHIELVTAELLAPVEREAVVSVREAVLISLLAADEHARAERAVVRAASDEEWVTVTIRTHAGGFSQDAESPYEKRLSLLHQIADHVGGRAEVWSAEGRGVRVTLVVPVAESSGPRDGLEQSQGLSDRRVGSGGAGQHDGTTQLQPLRPGSQQRSARNDADGDALISGMAGPRPSVLARERALLVSGRHEWSDEATQANQTMLTLFMSWRFSGLVTGLAALVAGRKRYRSQATATSQLVAAVAESVWLARRFVHNGYRFDQKARRVDLATAIAVLLVGRANLVAEDRWTWINWAPWSFAADAVSGRAIDVQDPLSDVLGSVAIIGAGAALADRWSDRAINAGGMTACFLVAQLFVRQFRTAAVRLEAARSAGMREGSRLAVEQERSRQLRLLHDSALQTLEAVGSGRYSDLASIQALALDEAERLEHELEGTMPPVRSLRGEIEAVVDEHSRQGLHVDLIWHGASDLPVPVVLALRHACNEALMNVRKHAGTSQAVVTIKPAHGGMRMTVRDDGKGFDPSLGTGFGTTQSIIERMAEVGGSAEIDSAPGGGTRVTLWGPS